MQYANNNKDSSVYTVCYQLHRLKCICSMLPTIKTLLYMQYATNDTDSTVYAVCHQWYRLYCICSMLSVTQTLHSIHTFSLASFFFLTIMKWMNTVQSYLQLELWSLTICASLHSTTLPTSKPCYNALVFINQFYTTEYANLTTAKMHSSTFSSYSKSVHWQYCRWKTQDVKMCKANDENETRCN
jgi:hypothetical protein